MRAVAPLPANVRIFGLVELVLGLLGFCMVAFLLVLSLLGELGFGEGVLLAWAGLASVLGIAGGLALLDRRPVGRGLSLVFYGLLFPALPLGTALAVVAYHFLLEANPRPWTPGAAA